MPLLDQMWSCSRKVAYRTKREARVVADRRREEGSMRLEAYRCLFCNRWHLTKRRAK